MIPKRNKDIRSFQQLAESKVCYPKPLGQDVEHVVRHYRLHHPRGNFGLASSGKSTMTC